VAFTPTAIYIRVSTVEQAEKGWSLEGQLKECRGYCAANDLKVVRIYKDKGFSGGSIERPHLQKMLEQASMGSFEYLVLWRYDRLSRNNIDFPALLHFLQKCGVTVVSVQEPTPNDGSPYNEFIVGILGLVSSLERKVIMMRTNMGIKTRLEKGYYRGSGVPYGYKYNRNSGHLEIIVEEAEIVRLIFSKYLELQSICSVRAYLRDNDISTKRGGRWHRSTVRRILRNRTYLGEYSACGITTAHLEVRIIDDETFDKAQRLLAERTHLSPWSHVDPKIYYDFSGEINFDNPDPILTKYLEKKAEMPPCPKCGKVLTVIRWGHHHSSVYGQLQQYVCKGCNYEFTPHPEKPIRKDVENCPKCHSRKHVRKEGKYYSKSLKKDIQKYLCNECNHIFVEYPKDWRGEREPCPICNGTHVRKNGVRTKRDGTKRQIWICLDCDKQFSLDIRN